MVGLTAYRCGLTRGAPTRYGGYARRWCCRLARWLSSWLGYGDCGRLRRPLGAPPWPQGPPHNAMKPPQDRPLPWQVLAWVCASCGLCSSQHGRWRPSPRDDPGVHQQLPTGRTPFRVHLTPLGTDGLPIKRDWDNHGRLPYLRPAEPQRLRMGVMVQPIAAYHPALRGRHMQQPPLQKVL